MTGQPPLMGGPLDGATPLLGSGPVARVVPLCYGQVALCAQSVDNGVDKLRIEG